MAYSTASPPTLVNSGPGQKIWMYTSTDDVATVTAADYFSNGDDLGMNVGDFVVIFDSSAPDGGVAFVTAVTSGGAATALESQAVTS